MNPLFEIHGGRFSSAVKEVEPETARNSELNLQVRILCDGAQVACYRLGPVHDDQGSQRMTVVDLSPFCTVDEALDDLRDLDDYRFVEIATDAFCRGLLAGKPVKDQCEKIGLPRYADQNLRRKRGLPAPLLIRTEGVRFFFRCPRPDGGMERQELRGGLYR